MCFFLKKHTGTCVFLKKEHDGLKVEHDEVARKKDTGHLRFFQKTHPVGATLQVIPFKDIAASSLIFLVAHG